MVHSRTEMRKKDMKNISTLLQGIVRIRYSKGINLLK